VNPLEFVDEQARTVLGYSWVSEAPAPRRPTLENLQHRVYEVAPGDTLSQIADGHGLTLRQLVRDNDIDDPALVRIGQKLRIRAAQPPAAHDKDQQAERAGPERGVP
jgi:LysM repeat protein